MKWTKAMKWKFEDFDKTRVDNRVTIINVCHFAVSSDAASKIQNCRNQKPPILVVRRHNSMAPKLQSEFFDELFTTSSRKSSKLDFIPPCLREDPLLVSSKEG